VTEKKPFFSIVLPCYNEAGNLPLLAERFASFVPDYHFELLLVNNGSTDHSASVLKDLAEDHSFIRVVDIEWNIGYGHGIHTGLSVAKGEFLAFSHADIQTPPEDLFKAFDLMLKQPVELRSEVMVKGFRTNKTADIMTRGLEMVCFLLTGYHLSDINGQPKLFHPSFFSSLPSPPFDFSYDAWILLKSAQKGHRLLCFDVRFGDRIHGISKSAPDLFRKWRTIMQFLRSLAKISRQEKADPRNLPAQFFRFLQTGILTNVLNYLCFILCLYPLQLPYLLSSAAGFATGFAAGFFLNRNYTFKAVTVGEKTGISASLMRFFLVNLLSLLLNLLVVWLAVEQAGMIPELAQCLGIAVSALFNFFGCRFFVF
jgi:glycosyltransferase involved in cell wall biosynthesis